MSCSFPVPGLAPLPRPQSLLPVSLHTPAVRAPGPACRPWSRKDPAAQALSLREPTAGFENPASVRDKTQQKDRTKPSAA